MIWTRAVVSSGIGPTRSLARQEPTIEIAAPTAACSVRSLGERASGQLREPSREQLDEPVVGGDPVAGQLRLRGGMARGEDEASVIGELGDEVERRAATPAATPRGHSSLGRAGGDDRRVEAVEGALLGGEQAVEFVVEDLVEGPPRDPCLLDHIGDRQRGVTLLGEDFRRRVEQPVALVFGDQRLRDPVAAAREGGIRTRLPRRRSCPRSSCPE